MKKNNKETGFTIVEMVVTIVVAVVIIGVFYQLYVSLVQASSTARRDAAANNLAYSLLRTRPTTISITGTPDCAAYPVGSPISTSTGSTTELGNYTQTLTASCPYASSTTLTKIEATVTYKNNTLSVKQVTYVN